MTWTSSRRVRSWRWACCAEPITLGATQVGAGAIAEDGWDFRVLHPGRSCLGGMDRLAAGAGRPAGSDPVVGHGPGQQLGGPDAGGCPPRRAHDRAAVAAYLESVYGKVEWETAWREDPLGEQRKLIVLRVAECERPGVLGSVVSADLFGLGEAAAHAELRRIIEHALSGRANPEAEPAFPGGVVLPQAPPFPARCRYGMFRRSSRTSRAP